MAIRLIVGLGNPGSDYAKTRHNIGFMVLDALASAHGLSWQSKSRYSAELCDWTRNSDRLWLIKPMTFMNRSGEAVSRFAKDHELLPEHILVIHDELDFPLGKVRGVVGRGPAGHNGIRSLIAALGGNGFYRVRIGIGKPDRLQTDGKDFVLSRFGESEKKQVDDLIGSVVEAIDFVLELPWDQAVQKVNIL